MSLLVESAAEIGFVWSSELVGWVREGLPVLSNLAGPIQHFRAAVLDWGWVGNLGLCGPTSPGSACIGVVISVHCVARACCCGYTHT